MNTPFLSIFFILFHARVLDATWDTHYAATIAVSAMLPLVRKRTGPQRLFSPSVVIPKTVESIYESGCLSYARSVGIFDNVDIVAGYVQRWEAFVYALFSGLDTYVDLKFDYVN